MLNIALIGCGRIGRMHADLVHANPRCRLATVHDAVADAAAAVAERTGARVAEEVDALFADAGIDGIMVASVTSTHADFIERSVAAGKPVFCEKPIDLDMARVRACRAVIADSGVPVQIGFNRRFDPGHRGLRDAVAAGEIGDLYQLLITSRDPAPPTFGYVSTAGGFFRDMTIHDFDIARFVLGADEPVEVFAYADALIEPSIAPDLGEIDCAMVLMRTGSGRQVLINNSRQAPYGYDQRMEALGDKGMVQSTNRTPHGLTRFSATGTAAGQPYEAFFIERYRDAFTGQLDGFLDVIEHGTPPVATFDDGMRALMLAEAAYVALKSGSAAAVDAE